MVTADVPLLSDVFGVRARGGEEIRRGEGVVARDTTDLKMSSFSGRRL